MLRTSFANASPFAPPRPSDELGQSFPENPPHVLVVQFVGDAFVGEADELGERRGSRRFILCHRANAVPRPKPDVAGRAGNSEAKMILPRSTW